MWLDPTNTHVAGSSKSWLVLNENEFFVLQQYQVRARYRAPSLSLCASTRTYLASYVQAE